MEVMEEADYIPIATLSRHHQNDSCIKMGSDESHFNVSLIVWDSHKTVSTNHNFWREMRAEAVSNRGSSAYQPTALTLGQTGSHNFHKKQIIFYSLPPKSCPTPFLLSRDI